MYNEGIRKLGLLYEDNNATGNTKLARGLHRWHVSD
jgi:hypothetical protein